MGRDGTSCTCCIKVNDFQRCLLHLLFIWFVLISRPHWTGCQRRDAIILLWSAEQSLFTLQSLTRTYTYLKVQFVLVNDFHLLAQ